MKFAVLASQPSCTEVRPDAEMTRQNKMDFRSPRLSVVMGVYNAGETLQPTVESVLMQTFRDFEFIIVDDGSTDETGKTLDSLSRKDKRVKVIRQSNQGLTKALIEGCRRAQGDLIARVDAGDRSMADRFEKQIAFLVKHREVVAIGSGVRRVSSNGEFLGDSVRDETPDQTTERFLVDQVGLSHPASLFRSEAYHRAGGYREEFRFAQDTDLWYRIVREGKLANIPEPLIELRVDTDGISPQNSERQARLADLAYESYQAQGKGIDDREILAKAKEVSWAKIQVGTKPKYARAKAEHFIGSQLYSLGDQRCRRYFWKSIRCNPLSLPPWIKLLLSFFNTSKIGE